MTLDVCYVHLVISIGTNWTNWGLPTMSLPWVETFFFERSFLLKVKKNNALFGTSSKYKRKKLRKIYTKESYGI